MFILCRIALLMCVATVQGEDSPFLFPYKLIKSAFGPDAPSEEWSYEHPEQWPETCRIGRAQSPVNIVEKDAVRIPIPQLSFNYSYTGRVLIATNGHTAGIHGFDKWLDRQPFIESGGLNGRYFLQQIHLHWNVDANGSEHTVNGKHYPVEVHFVHAKAGSPTETDPTEKFAVVAVFLELQGRDNQPLEAQFFSHLKLILTIEDHQKGASVASYFSPSVFLPRKHADFFRYDGSLTTPGCGESVVWTVLRDTVKISPKQLKELRALKMHQDHPFVNNTRPIQPLNGRRVFANTFVH